MITLLSQFLNLFPVDSLNNTIPCPLCKQIADISHDISVDDLWISCHECGWSGNFVEYAHIHINEHDYTSIAGLDKDKYYTAVAWLNKGEIVTRRGRNIRNRLIANQATRALTNIAVRQLIEQNRKAVQQLEEEYIRQTLADHQIRHQEP